MQISLGHWFESGSRENFFLFFLIRNFSDPPEITGEQSYIQDEGSIMLELVCIVHAYPKAEVTWYKDGQQLVESDSINVEKIGRKHLLQVRNLDEIRDAGTYTCHAVNPVGEFKENFHIQGIYLSFKYLIHTVRKVNFCLKIQFYQCVIFFNFS